MTVKRRNILGFFITVATLLTTLQGRTDTTYFFDWDNTVVENRRQYKGTFQGTVELYRINRRGNLFQNPLTSPKAVQVTWADFHERLKPFLAKDAKTQGQVGKKITLSDGRVIEPGNYYVRADDSFRFYFPGEDGENYLTENYDKARKLAKRGQGTWKGMAYGVYQYLLSDEDSAARVGRITMNGYTVEQWQELDNKMIKDGEIKNAPNPKLTFGITTPEFDEFTHYFEDGERARAKKLILEDFIKMKGRQETPDGKPHKIIFFEDDQETIKAVLEIFQKYTQGRFFNIEFGIANLGYKNEVEASGRPRIFMLNKYGIPVRANEDDIFGEIKKSTGRKPTKCALQLLEVAK